VDVGVMYASRYLRLPAGALGGDRVVLDDAHPGRPRGLAAQTVEGDRWIVTLSGYGPEHHPPADSAGWLAFLATVADAEVRAAFEQGEPLGEIETHAFPAAVRRRYDRLRRVPQGLLVAGDAMCNLNPIYGQGMSVAALEAVALQRTLLAGDDRLTERYFDAARRPVEHAWKLATDADRGLPELGLPAKPTDRLLNRYYGRLIAAAEHDEALARILYDVTGMLVAPARLLAPPAIARVLRGPGRRGASKSARL
jgi:2-polyprenyl-6-methoxyphenol hydroxylase-like FAD-dependent oxidoreductase